MGAPFFVLPRQYAAGLWPLIMPIMVLERVFAMGWALQEAADRLEALPGIQAVPCEHWPQEGLTLERYGNVRALRGLPS